MCKAGDFRPDLVNAGGEAEIGQAVRQRVLQRVEGIVVDEHDDSAVSGTGRLAKIGALQVNRNGGRVANFGSDRSCPFEMRPPMAMGRSG